ncbi:MAG: GNAT family N-acyltransferase [Pseudomonadota bacterium]
MHGQFEQHVVPHLPVGPSHQVAPVVKGLWRGRLAENAMDRAAALELRSAQFRDGDVDEDALDEVCRHVLVEPVDGGPPVATFRFLHLSDGAGIALTYSAQFYDLGRMKDYDQPVLEIGRFCTQDGIVDGDVLRVGWAVLTRYVDAYGIGIMFGCSSFPGNDVSIYRDGLALLKERYLAPERWRPGIKAAETAKYSEMFMDYKPTLKAANQQLPSLLRTYLTMGGWVSDHAVIDRDLGTFHVFTGVEISAIPETRKRLLRADAA